jgi:hypothetical protein
MFARLALVLLLAGCGDRSADLTLTLAPSCNVPIPAGGSILYQVSAGSGSFCGGCLPVANALADATATLAFLRANAPVCNGIKPNVSLRVSLTAFKTGDCSGDAAGRVYCSQSMPVQTGDGTSDAVLEVKLECDTSCSTIACTPTTCQALGKNCGQVFDGCSAMLNCGTCIPPQMCGGHGGSGTPNVCSK